MGDSNIKNKVGTVYIAIATVFILLGFLYYSISGEDLIYRDSAGNYNAPEPNDSVTEIYEGRTFEYFFSAPIQHIRRMDITWSNYERPCTGTITVEVFNEQEKSLVTSESFDSAELYDKAVRTLVFPEGEDLYNVPMKLVVRSDCPVSNGGTILRNVDVNDEKNTFFMDGEQLEGTLCVSLTGKDDIWLGKHFWLFFSAGACLVIGVLIFSWCRFVRGKRSIIAIFVIAMYKYRFLIKQFVSRDFKTKYKRSALGILWSFINPLLTMLVQYIVFSTIFKSDIDNFPSYLLVGVVSMNFFNEACGMALTSILGNANLITKVYMPKYIYPLTRVISSLVNLAISFIPMIAVCLLTGVVFTWKSLLGLYFIACLIIFAFGLSLVLSALMVFFRDTQFIWNVISMIWMYLTPVFYPESILPDEYRFVLIVNPLNYFIKGARSCILYNASPEPMFYILSLLMALAMLAVGAVIFKKSQNKFILYL